MEKFGIFELLDTLSALSSAQSEDKKEEETATADAAPSVPKESSPPPDADLPDPKRSALQSLLARHDGISKRIDKNK